MTKRPSSAGTLHEEVKVVCPFEVSSTRQTRQAPIGSTASCEQSDGIENPWRRATLSTYSPSCAITGMSLMVSRMVMVPPLFHLHRILVADILADAAFDALFRHDAMDLFFLAHNGVLRTVR